MSKCVTKLRSNTDQHGVPPAHRSTTSGATKLSTAVLLALATLPATGGFAHAVEENPCQEGTFCAWGEAQFRGKQHMTNPRDAKLETCLPMPEGLEATSFVNRTGHPVTVYQDPTCSSEADFSTYPSETFVPDSPYVARAIKIWTH